MIIKLKYKKKLAREKELNTQKLLSRSATKRISISLNYVSNDY